MDLEGLSLLQKMAPLVKLGPIPLASKTSLTPMMKEISQRKIHIDLVFSCDDGSVSGHKFVVGAQSKVGGPVCSIPFFQLYNLYEQR